MHPRIFGRSSAYVLKVGLPCEADGIGYIFGLAGNGVLHRQVYEAGDGLKVTRAEQGAEKLRGCTETRYAAASWATERRVIARFEATTQGFDARFIVTTLTGEAQHLYETVYCQHGQAENLIKPSCPRCHR